MVEKEVVDPWSAPGLNKNYMILALETVGLPVKCRTCGKRGHVKPGDYGGWWRWRFVRGTSRWYCPEDAPKGQAMKDQMDMSYPTPEPTPPPVEDSLEDSELYKLLD